MTDQPTPPSPTLLSQYINDMSSDQGAIFDTQKGLQQLRQDARLDGYNVDALNLLIQVRGRNHPDGGSRILNDLVSYAMNAGIAFDNVIPHTPKSTSRHTALEDHLSEDGQDPEVASGSYSYLQMALQITIGAALGISMLNYLQ